MLSNKYTRNIWPCWIHIQDFKDPIPASAILTNLMYTTKLKTL